MINLIIKISFYSGLFLLGFIGVQFIFQLIKSDKTKYLKSFRLFLNFGILLTLCWGAFMSLAVVVNLPIQIAETEKQSLINLNNWIIRQELKIAFLLITVTGILGLFRYWYQRKWEKLNAKKPIINLTLINCLIILFSLILIYVHTYNELAIEVGYFFK